MTSQTRALVKVTRMIATWPPPEAGEDEDTVWVLEVMAYGMAEAPQHWHKSIDHTLVGELKMINFPAKKCKPGVQGEGHTATYKKR